jgi:hypothetical protein
MNQRFLGLGHRLRALGLGAGGISHHDRPKMSTNGCYVASSSFAGATAGW